MSFPITIVIRRTSAVEEVAADLVRQLYSHFTSSEQERFHLAMEERLHENQPDSEGLREHLEYDDRNGVSHGLTLDLARANSAKADLQEDYDSLESRCGYLEQERSELQSELGVARDRIVALERDFDRLENGL